MPAHSTASGLDLHESKRLKEPVRAASTGNITLATPGTTIDGVTLASGDRILLKNQVPASENGIYTWSGAASLLVRTADTDEAADFVHGFLIYVREGTTNGATFWAYTTSTTPIVLGSTTLTFLAFTGIGPTGATGADGAPGATGAPGAPGTLTVSGAAPHIMIEDRKLTGTQGGGFTSGADQIRTLTLISEDTNSLAALANNQITLPAGTFRYHITAPAYNVGQHQAMLYSVSGATVVRRGTSEYSQTGADATMSCSVIKGRIGLRSATIFEVRHRCQTTRATAGFGVATSFVGGYELYTVAEFWLEAGPPPFYGPGSAVLDMPVRRKVRYMGQVEHSLDTTP